MIPKPSWACKLWFRTWVNGEALKSSKESSVSSQPLLSFLPFSPLSFHSPSNSFSLFFPPALQSVCFPSTQFMCLFCLQTCLHSDPDLLTLIRKRLSQVMVPNFFVSYHFLHGHKPCGNSNSRCNCVTDPHMSCTLKSAIRKSLYLFYFNSSKRNSLDITN